jgi:hypothetical protein
MSIEDINYLRNNSIKQHYTFIIDSVDRDRYKYPNPNKYIIEFNVPFKNVIGLEIIDSSIPRTMYNIDYENNLIYYYIGKKNNDYNIINGIKDIENETNLLINCNFSEDGYAIIENNKYIELNNNINLYNIYKSGGIGGDNIGITFSFKIKVSSNISNIINVNEKYYILNMGYYHLHLIDDLDNPTIGRYLYSGILVYIKTNIVTPSLYDIYFVIGYDSNDDINIKKIIQGVNLEIENHICWTISENNDWRIYISTKSELYTKVNNYKSINNVFYTEKNIGRECNNTFNDLTKISELTYKYGWNNNIKLHIKDFKIYNKVLTEDDIEMCKNNTMNMKNLPVWYKLDSNIIDIDHKINKLNSGSSIFINYEDIFVKFTIEEGDYTFKSFLTKYDKIDTYEIGFKKHTDPAEVSNLLDIYSMNPFIIDMKKSTISENLGFDLYANAVPQHNNVRYINKPINNTQENMMKMFYSISITNNEKKVSNVGVYDNYIVTSPGIVYFIGNKYILLRCPEIEEHLFGSLSYSKYSLGLAKFRVDNVGINTERLVITKLPVREFHPIGKLSRLTLIFETSKGTLYDFKGVNHNITFAVYYFEPTQNKFPEGSILNPEYKMNYMEYKYYQEGIEGDSEEEEIDEYSRDDIDDYIKKENEYSNEGMEHKKYREYYEAK